jgi:membrane protein involved in colicin uptake
MGGGYDGKGGFQHSPQIYKQLDLIKQAEKFVAEQIAIEEAAAKAAAELKAKQDAEAKAAAELKAKQDAEAAAELKAKQDAEAKAAARIKKSTITCIKGKTIKKVTAVNPKCPKGYKKK